MKQKYNQSSLSLSAKEEFKGFGISNKAMTINAKQYLKLNTNEHSLISFAGLLRLSNDTIFYLSNLNRNEIEQPLFIFNAPKFSSWKVEYQNNSIDSITFIEKSFFTEFDNDTLYDFYISPIIRANYFHGMHSKLCLISLNKKGIKYLSFCHQTRQVTYRVDEDITEFSNFEY